MDLGRNLRLDVRFGSKADIRLWNRHVRFTPKRRHRWAPSSCPLCANSGHSVRSLPWSLRVAGSKWLTYEVSVDANDITAETVSPVRIGAAW